MTMDPLRYDKWIEDALRGVIRRVLVQTAVEGLPGDHYFYITFRTKTDGVTLPGNLLAVHPDEMTIVLQHQFDDLVVDEDAFQVTLYFKGKGERLRVPLNAVTAFADPSVNFGLELKTIRVPGKALATRASAVISAPDRVPGSVMAVSRHGEADQTPAAQAPCLRRSDRTTTQTNRSLHRLRRASAKRYRRVVRTRRSPAIAWFYLVHPDRRIAS